MVMVTFGDHSEGNWDLRCDDCTKNNLDSGDTGDARQVKQWTLY